MLTRDDILAISKLLDDGFNKFGANIDERFDKVDERFSEIDKRFNKIDKRFSEIDERFSEIDKRFSEIDKRFDKIDERFDRLEASVDERFIKVNARLDKVENRFDKFEINVNERFIKLENEMKDGFAEIHIILENEIKPDIKLLAECYLPAAERYNNAMQDYESMKTDIDLLKRIVADHSEKLQKIS